MSPPHAKHKHCASWSIVLLVFFVLETLATSCATSEEDAPTPGNEIDNDAARDFTADASDAACELDSDSCAKQEQSACNDVEWCLVETNYQSGYALSSIWGSGKNDVWVVGAAGSVIHWDGHEWASASVETTWTLYAVWGTGPTDVWAVSSPNKIFHTTGFVGSTTQWSPVTAVPGMPSTSPIIRAIWGTSPGDVWIGGNFSMPDPNSNLRESSWRSIGIDGGTAWTSTSSFQDIDIRSIWGSGPDDIWLVGRSQAYLGVGFAVHTNGVVPADTSVPLWTEFDTQSISILYAVWGSSSSDVWAVGDYGTIRHFTAGAEKWSVVDSPTTENLRALWGAGANDIWAVGEHGTLLHYDGTAWRLSTGAFPPGEKPHLYSVWGSSSADVWAVGDGIVMHFSGPKPGAQGAAAP